MIRKGKKKDVITPLNDVLTDALKRSINKGKVGKGELVFPYSIYWLPKVWRKIREEAELEESERIHDLRHAFGS